MLLLRRDSFESEYSESVMNGFLLKVAIDAAEGMFAKLGDSSFAKELKSMSSKLSSDLTDNCWKGDFFASAVQQKFKAKS